MLREYIQKRVSKESTITTTHKPATIIFKNEDLNISANMPCVIAGKKGSGKTSFINGLIDGCYENKQYDNVIYIYVNSIDDNLNENVTRVSIDDAEELLNHFFEIKNRFNSCVKFLLNLRESNFNKRELTLKDFMGKYNDNTLEEIANEINIRAPNDHELLVKDLLDYAVEFIKMHKKSFYITIGKHKHLIRGFTYDCRDLVVIDDIAIAANILFKSQRKNKIYKYFTLTRHLNVCIILACQEISQVPKMIRKEIDTWIIARHTNTDFLDDIISKKNLMKLQDAQGKLNPYEFAVLNLTNSEVRIV